MALNDKSKFHTIESHMSPKMHREFHMAPKPKEVSYGIFKETKQIKKKVAPKKQEPEQRQKLIGKALKFQGRSDAQKRKAFKAKHVKDMLQKHEKPEIVETKPQLMLPDHVSEVKCLDAKGCRLNAIVKRTRGLPVFSPLDESEPFRLEDLPSLDFVFIQIHGRVHRGLYPYTGSRWYAAETCEYLLEQKIITPANCKAAFRATRHVPSSVLASQV
jgi:hypothetical protein